MLVGLPSVNEFLKRFLNVGLFSQASVHMRKVKFTTFTHVKLMKMTSGNQI